MSVKFILDTREKALQTVFNNNETNYIVKQLDLGDILIEYNTSANSKDEETTPSSQTLVIERKTFTDLKASMGDTRYHEQKSRYLQLPVGTVYYILENNDQNFASLDKKQFIGTYVNTMVRDNIKVFITNSIKETYELIIKIGEAVEKFGINSKINSTPNTQIKKKKAEGIEVFKQQLTCFPGISDGKANSIAEIYPNMKMLIEAIEKGTFKVKGIGKVLLDKIKSNLFLTNE